MNSQIQTQLITILFVLFFASTLSPISLVLHISTIFNIHFLMQSSTSQSSNKIPCTFINMDKTSQLLKKLKPSSSTVAPTKAAPVKHIPITIPAKLTSAQKEAALPFLNEQPLKSKSSKAKVKNNRDSLYFLKY